MSHQWEHKLEYIQLVLDMNRALRDGDYIHFEQLRARKTNFDRLLWDIKKDHFKELLPYHTVTDALVATASHLGVTFPDLKDPHIRTGDGQFIFGISDGQRTVQIWPMEDLGYYSIEIFVYIDSISGLCYEGHTTSLDEATIVLSRWFMERCSIESLHAQFPWMSREPLRLTGPRMTFED